MIKIPDDSLILLNKDDYLANIVNTYLSQYTEYLSLSGFNIFFPEYTDHGFLHTQEILNLCEFLICDNTYDRPSAWQFVTSHDIAILVFAVVLHDIAMHFTKMDAIALLKDDKRKVNGIDNESWADMWQSFLEESQRWDGRQLIFVYGDDYETQLGERAINRIPSGNENLWDSADHRLIGEFLRRNHARIAHEIAVMGFPSQPRILNLSTLFQDKYEHIPHIAGAVARSHGSSIRDALPFIEPFSVRELKGAHPTYLMTLLRIADSMHIHSERAPGGKKAIQKRTSPISKREFAAHQAIADVRLNSEPDPEAIFIEVTPTKLLQTETYFRIKEWLINLQSELDSSWAILGEIYGRYDLNNLWLTVRRVNSNLNKHSLLSILPFYPVKAYFGAGNANFLKLLVKPLYGNRPEIAIRELMQNAIDAVREHDYLQRSGLLKDSSEYPIIDEKYPDADISIGFYSQESFKGDTANIPKSWQYWIEVKDKGVGMTPRSITDYFLKAGSTFRNSDYWKGAFLNESGESKVLRSGRFGVGVLAAFLIGDQINVTTRHFTEKSGIWFVAGLDDEYIQFNKVNGPIGTSIKIRCDKEIFDELGTRYHYYYVHWYYLSWPKIVCRTDNEYKLPYKEDSNNEEDSQEDLFPFIPNQDAILPPDWRRIRCKGFADIHWRYEKYGSSALYCNGIKIPLESGDIVWKDPKYEKRPWMLSRRSDDPLVPQIPTVSVFDPNGKLNLNLARDSLTTKTYPFSKTLLKSVYLDIIAHSLVCGPDRQAKSKEFSKLKQMAYVGLKDSARYQTTQWLYTKTGFTIADSYMANTLLLKRIIILTTRPNRRWLPAYNCSDDEGLLLFRDESDADSISGDCLWPLNNLSGFQELNNPDINAIRGLNFSNVSLLIPSPILGLVERKIGKSLRKLVNPRIKSLSSGKFFIIHSSENSTVSNEKILIEAFSRKNIANHMNDSGIVSVVELDRKAVPVPSILSKLWLDILGQSCIPYVSIR